METDTLPRHGHSQKRFHLGTHKQALYSATEGIHVDGAGHQEIGMVPQDIAEVSRRPDMGHVRVPEQPGRDGRFAGQSGDVIDQPGGMFFLPLVPRPGDDDGFLRLMGGSARALSLQPGIDVGPERGGVGR